MKSTVFGFLLAYLAVVPNKAFTQKSQLNASIGMGNPDAMTQFGQYGSGYHYFTSAANPSFFITYRYFFTRKVSIGVALGTYGDNGYCEYQQDYDSWPIGAYKKTNYVISPEMTFIRFSRHHFKIYQLVALGIRIENVQFTLDPDVNSSTTPSKINLSPNQSYILPIVQLTPFAMQYGSKHFGGFIELGFGYKGIVNGGVYCRP